VTSFDAGDELGSSFRNDEAATRAAFGTHVDDPVGGLHHVEVVFDHDDAVALVDQRLEHQQQFPDVLEVQAGRRLVQNVDRATGLPLLKFRCQLHPLGLAAGERRSRLSEPDVAEADINQRLQVPRDGWDGGEELGAFLDRHVEHLGNGLALEVHVERLAVVASAVAHRRRRAGSSSRS
jgi:hypothetical protein